MCRLILNGIVISVDLGDWLPFFYHCLLLTALLFMVVSVSSSSGYLGWDALFYCGTP